MKGDARPRWIKDPEALEAAYKDLILEILFPPEPWSLFGTHLDAQEALVFWGQGEDGLPLWERPVTAGFLTRVPEDEDD